MCHVDVVEDRGLHGKKSMDKKQEPQPKLRLCCRSGVHDSVEGGVIELGLGQELVEDGV